MNLRKITSLTLLCSFVLLVVTSIVLYIVPEGRIAYWSDWRLLWLTKTQWADVHTNSGFLFLAAGLLHLWYNWSPIITYMKNKAKELRIFTPAFTVALLVNSIFILGTLLHLPPFSTILSFGQSFKDAAAIKYGEPPYGRAELSTLTLFAKRTGLDLDATKDGLVKAGMNFTGGDQTVLAIAKNNNTTPKVIYDAMQGGGMNKTDSILSFPKEPLSGAGRMILNDLCTQYGLDRQQILAALAAKGITADPKKSLQEIASDHGTESRALYGIIHEAAVQQ